MSPSSHGSLRSEASSRRRSMSGTISPYSPNSMLPPPAPSRAAEARSGLPRRRAISAARSPSARTGSRRSRQVGQPGSLHDRVPGSRVLCGEEEWLEGVNWKALRIGLVIADVLANRSVRLLAVVREELDELAPAPPCDGLDPCGDDRVRP